MELDEWGKPIAPDAGRDEGGVSCKSQPRTKNKSSNRGGRPAALRPPGDAKEYRGKFYKVFPQQATWLEARVRCQKIGGHLAVVKSEEENQFLTSLMKNQGVTVAWLGATDELVEGRWAWVDGEPLRYNNWNPGQPNNKQGREHYMVMIVANDGKWSDQPNESAQWSPGFICQWE